MRLCASGSVDGAGWSQSRSSLDSNVTSQAGGSSEAQDRVGRRGKGTTPSQPSKDARYKAFISYSRSDGTIARTVAKALEQLAKPVQKRRIFDVYLDREEVSAGGALPDKLVASLDDSEFLILIASSESATSTWVDWEVSHWIASRGTSQILIVLVDGDLVWDSDAAGFTSSAGEALPPSLLEAIEVLPVWIDLRPEAEMLSTQPAMAESRLTLDNAEFKLKIAALQAPLRGPNVAPSDIVGEDLDLWRRARRLRRVVSIALTVLVVSVLGVGWQFLQSREATRIERADRLAAEAGDVYERAPDIGLAMYLQSLSISPLDRNVTATFRALETAPGPIRIVATTDPLEGVVVRPGGGWATIDRESGNLLLWNGDGDPDGFVEIARDDFKPQMLRGGGGVVVAAGPSTEAVAVVDLDRAAASFLEWVGAVIAAVDISENGEQVAAGDLNGRVRVWTLGDSYVEIDTRSQLDCDGSQTCRIVSLAFDELTGDLAIGTQACIGVWIIDQERPRWTECELRFPPAAIASVADEIVYSSGGDALFVKAVDGATARRPLVGFSADADIAGIAIGPRGDLAATVRKDGSAVVWEISGDPRPRAVVAMESNANLVGPALALDESQRLAVSLPDGRMVIWNVSERSALTRAVRGGVKGVDAIPSGGLAVDGIGRVLLVDSDAVIGSAEPCSGTPDAPSVVAFASDESAESFVVGFSDGSVDVTTPTGSYCVHLDEAAGSVGISTEGSRVAVGTPEAVYSWRPGVEGARRVATDGDRRALHVPVAVSDNGEFLAYGRSDGAIVVISAEDWDQPRVIAGAHRTEVDSLAFSPDAKFVASGSDDREVAVWDVGSLTEVQRFLGHGERVRYVAFSDDGNRLASAAEDGIVIVWDRSTGSTAVAPMHHVSRPRGIAWTMDGLYVLDGDSLVLWPLSPLAWFAAACEIIESALLVNPTRFPDAESVAAFCAS